MVLFVFGVMTSTLGHARAARCAVVVLVLPQELFFPTPVFKGEKAVTFESIDVEDMDPTMREVVLSVKSAGLEGKFRRNFVLKLFKEFQRRATVEKDGRRVLPSKDFEELFRTHMKVEDPAVLVKVLRVFDTSGDGNIDFTELLQTLAFAAEGSETEKLQLMFKSFDLNDDGVISRDEMARFLKAMFKIIQEEKTDIYIQNHVEQLFTTFDKDRDNHLTMEGKQSLATSPSPRTQTDPCVFLPLQSSSTWAVCTTSCWTRAW